MVLVVLVVLVLLLLLLLLLEPSLGRVLRRRRRLVRRRSGCKWARGFVRLLKRLLWLRRPVIRGLLLLLLVVRAARVVLLRRWPGVRSRLPLLWRSLLPVLRRGRARAAERL
jgi:hypothetical protein